jgi:hypothetical protein
MGRILLDGPIAFVHIPKTAGTAIREALRDRLVKTKFGHAHARDYMKRYPDVPRFAVVRDPYDRAVSMFRAFNERFFKDGTKRDTPEEFLRYFMGPEKTEILGVSLRAPQTDFIGWGGEWINYLAYFETLEEDLREVGITSLPKSNVSPKPFPMHAYYADPKARTLIDAIYDSDFESLGY